MLDVIRHALLAYTNSQETTSKFFMLHDIQAVSAKQPVGRPAKQKEEALFIPDLPDYIWKLGHQVVMNNGSDVPRTRKQFTKEDIDYLLKVSRKFRWCASSIYFNIYRGFMGSKLS